ncbi:MAG: hypothetical protein M9905_15570 [Rhizobiaceae bacterium]|nr:hypothetical protein [Rhizobiaceae bacterium]
MAFDDDSEVESGLLSVLFGATGSGILRLTLLFGSAAAALALFLAPLAEREADLRLARPVLPANVDTMSTGSITRQGGSYTVRRSVLQDMPDAVCIIRSDGGHSGDC